MEVLWEGLIQAFRLLFGGEHYIREITLLSLKVSGIAIFISVLIGVPLGSILALRRFPLRRILIALVFTGMGLPPIVVGLFVYILLSQVGPFGFSGWLFTPMAIVIAQVIIATPIVSGLTIVAVRGVNPQLKVQLKSLGATDWQATWSLLKEARLGVLVAVIAGFGRIISEVGAVMLVGGNIEGYTRVLTTAILLETRMGAFETAIALGLILLTIYFFVILTSLRLQRKILD